jgi:ankyrin repeat protein
MFYAALGGKVQVMRYLLDHGADPAMPQERGSTPLHNAAEEGGLSHASFSLLSWYLEFRGWCCLRGEELLFKCSGSDLFGFALCLMCLQDTWRL